VLQPELVDRPCPDCQIELAPGAMKCRCGWKAKPTATDLRREHVPCDGLPDCTNSATVRIGEANVCMRCYSTEAPRLRRDAKDPNANSPAVRECLEAFSKSRYIRRVQEVGVERAKAEAMREAGQDDEERRGA